MKESNLNFFTNLRNKTYGNETLYRIAEEDLTRYAKPRDYNIYLWFSSEKANKLRDSFNNVRIIIY